MTVSSLANCQSPYLEVEDDGPYQAENNRWFTVNDVHRINVHQLDLRTTQITLFGERTNIVLVP